MRLLQLLALLVVALQLWTLFPLPVSFWWSSRGTILTVPCSGFCGSKGGRRCRCATGNAATGRGISMVLSLIRPLVTVARRASTVFDNRSHLWGRAARTCKRWKRPWSRLARGAGQTSRWRRRGRWHAASASMWTIVGVRDTVRLRRLRLLRLVRRRRWLLRLSRLRRELRWLRMVRAGSHVVRLWRWRHTPTQRTWTWWRRTSRTTRTRTVSGRSWRLTISSGRLLAWACWSLSSMLGRRADALALLIGIERLRRQAGVPDLGQRTIPTSTCESGWSWSLRGLGRLRAPLRSSRTMDGGRLVSLRVNVLWDWCIALVGGAS